MTKVLTKEELTAKMRTIMTEQMSVTGNPRDPFEQKVTLAARLEEDLEVDSLDRVELAMSYEEEFDIELPEASDVELCATFGEQVDKVYDAYVKQHGVDTEKASG